MKMNLLLAATMLLFAPLTIVEAHGEVCALGYWISFPYDHAHQAGCKDPEGKNRCEARSEWSVHVYHAPATGFPPDGRGDGNILGDCNGDTVPADFDGHYDAGRGGGVLSVDSGDGVTSGSLVCLGEVGHHVAFGPINVVDAVLGTTVAYRVAADRVNLVPPTDPAAPDCGDFQTDESAICPSSPCTVGFLPGLDGAYVVYVGDSPFGLPGTQGHISWP